MNTLFSPVLVGFIAPRDSSQQQHTQPKPAVAAGASTPSLEPAALPYRRTRRAIDSSPSPQNLLAEEITGSANKKIGLGDKTTSSVKKIGLGDKTTFSVDAAQFQKLRTDLITALPQVNELVKSWIREKVKTATGQDIDPDKVYLHHFPDAQSTESKATTTGWQHTGKPDKSMTLTDAVMQHFFSAEQYGWVGKMQSIAHFTSSNVSPFSIFHSDSVGDFFKRLGKLIIDRTGPGYLYSKITEDVPNAEESWRQLDSAFGLYTAEAKKGTYDEKNELRLKPSAFLDMVRKGDVQSLVTNKLQQFWSSHSKEWITLAKTQFVGEVRKALLDNSLSPDKGLSEADYVMAMKAGASNVSLKGPATQSQLQTPAVPDPSVKALRFDINGYDASDIVRFVRNDGSEVVYIPGHKPAFYAFKNAEEIYRWVVEQGKDPHKAAALARHFSLKDRQQGVFGPLSVNGVDEALKKLGNGDMPANSSHINHNNKPITQDLFVDMAQQTQLRIESDANTEIKSNDDVIKEDALGMLQAANAFSPLLAFLGPIGIGIGALGFAGQIGMEIEKAVDGDTQQERQEGAQGAAMDVGMMAFMHAVGKMASAPKETPAVKPEEIEMTELRRPEVPETVEEADNKIENESAQQKKPFFNPPQRINGKIGYPMGPTKASVWLAPVDKIDLQQAGELHDDGTYRVGEKRYVVTKDDRAIQVAYDWDLEYHQIGSGTTEAPNGPMMERIDPDGNVWGEIPTEENVFNSIREAGTWNTQATDLVPSILTNIEEWPKDRNLVIINRMDSANNRNDWAVRYSPGKFEETHRNINSFRILPNDVVLERKNEDHYSVRLKDGSLQEVPADGDCLYRSVAIALNEGAPNGTFSVEMLRNAAADYLNQHSDTNNFLATNINDVENPPHAEWEGNKIGWQYNSEHSTINVDYPNPNNTANVASYSTATQESIAINNGHNYPNGTLDASTNNMQNPTKMSVSKKDFMRADNTLDRTAYLAARRGQDAYNAGYINDDGSPDVTAYRQAINIKTYKNLGVETQADYRQNLATKKGFETYADYTRFLTKEKGFPTLYAHKEYLKHKKNKTGNFAATKINDVEKPPQAVQNPTKMSVSKKDFMRADNTLDSTAYLAACRGRDAYNAGYINDDGSPDVTAHRQAINIKTYKNLGFETEADYRQNLLTKRNFETHTAYNLYLANQKGFETDAAYRQNLATEKGFETYAAYTLFRLKERGFPKMSAYKKYLKEVSERRKNKTGNFAATKINDVEKPPQAVQSPTKMSVSKKDFMRADNTLDSTAYLAASRGRDAYNAGYINDDGSPDVTAHRQAINIKTYKNLGFETGTDYRQNLATEKGFETYADYNLYLVNQKGFETYADYNLYLANQKGFETDAAYRQNLATEKGFETYAAYTLFRLKERGFPTMSAYKEYLKHKKNKTGNFAATKISDVKNPHQAELEKNKIQWHYDG